MPIKPHKYYLLTKYPLSITEERLLDRIETIGVCWAQNIEDADTIIIGDSIKSRFHLLGKFMNDRKVEEFTTVDNYIARNFFE